MACLLTSPSNRRILKLRLLIFSCGEPGKQLIQLVSVYTRSRKYCAIAFVCWLRSLLWWVSSERARERDMDGLEVLSRSRAFGSFASAEVDERRRFGVSFSFSRCG